MKPAESIGFITPTVTTSTSGGSYAWITVYKGKCPTCGR